MPIASAANLRLRWLRLFCSDAWVKAAFLPLDPDGIWWKIRSKCPPGLDATAMRPCPQCGRVCPPNGVSPVCCDCEAENQYEPFWEHVNNDPDLARELYHLQPRSISYRRFMEGQDDWEAVATRGDCRGRDTATSWAGKTFEALGTARTCLQRHQGCQLVLLPESYKALEKEIAEYKKNLKAAEEAVAKSEEEGDGERTEIKEEEMIVPDASHERESEVDPEFGAR